MHGLLGGDHGADPAEIMFQLSWEQLCVPLDVVPGKKPGLVCAFLLLTQISWGTCIDRWMDLFTVLSFSVKKISVVLLQSADLLVISAYDFYISNSVNVKYEGKCKNHTNYFITKIFCWDILTLHRLPAVCNLHQLAARCWSEMRRGVKAETWHGADFPVWISTSVFLFLPVSPAWSVISLLLKKERERKALAFLYADLLHSRTFMSPATVTCCLCGAAGE